MFDATQAIRREGPRGHFDHWLLVGLIGLAGVGVVMITSSSIAVADSQHMGAFYFLKRHLVFLAMGIAGACVVMRTELKQFETRAMPLLMLAFVLLLAVFVPHLGLRINGARRWLNLVFTTFQPVEAVKLILVMYVASYLVRHREQVETTFWGLLKPIAVAGVIVVLLLLQPDFGSSALLLAVTGGMLVLGGANMPRMFAPVLGLLPLLAAVAVSVPSTCCSTPRPVRM